MVIGVVRWIKGRLNDAATVDRQMTLACGPRGQDSLTALFRQRVTPEAC